MEIWHIIACVIAGEEYDQVIGCVEKSENVMFILTFTPLRFLGISSSSSMCYAIKSDNCSYCMILYIVPPKKTGKTHNILNQFYHT